MNEDFVSFDLAMKLKEKGFKEKCLAYYDVEDNVGLLYNTQYSDEALPCQYTDLLQCHNTGEAETQPDDSGFCVDAPTISQVLKWLREEKKIHVIIATFVDQLNRCYTWGYEIWNISEFPKHIQHVSVKTNFTGHDKAAIAGIEYCLDNLI